MKRLVILSFCAMLLAACTSKDDQVQKTNNQDKGTVTESAEPESNQQVDIQQKPAENESQSDYKELPTVLDQIGSDEYKQIIETDNPNKRVILFEDDNHQKKFKSIFIKHDNRLKVIDLTKDQLIINEII